jgi:hypothetical protein
LGPGLILFWILKIGWGPHVSPLPRFLWCAPLAAASCRCSAAACSHCVHSSVEYSSTRTPPSSSLLPPFSSISLVKSVRKGRFFRHHRQPQSTAAPPLRRAPSPLSLHASVRHRPIARRQHLTVGDPPGTAYFNFSPFR